VDWFFNVFFIIHLKSAYALQQALAAFSTPFRNMCRCQDAKDLPNVSLEIHSFSAPQDVICYNAAIGACGRSGRWHEALLLVNQLKDDLLQCYWSL